MTCTYFRFLFFFSEASGQKNDTNLWAHVVWKYDSSDLGWAWLNFNSRVLALFCMDTALNITQICVVVITTTPDFSTSKK